MPDAPTRDIFLAHAGLDDVDGWTTALAERLASRLPDAVLHRDGDPASCDVLLVLVSGAWTKSDDLHAALDAFATLPDAARRTVPVLLEDVPPAERPELCSGEVVIFYDARRTRIGSRHKAGSDLFEAAVERLAQRLHTLLDAPTTTPEPVSAPVEAGDVDDVLRVFLAASSNDLAEPCRDIAAAVTTLGARIIEDPSQAALSIHVLGPQPGRAVADGQSRPMAELRSVLDADAPERMLVLMDDDLRPDELVAGAYRDLVEEVLASERRGLTRARLGRREMIAEAERCVTELREARRVQTDLTAFVDVHARDMGHISELVEHLKTRQVRDVDMKVADFTPAERIEQNLAAARVCFMVYGETPPQDVDVRVARAFELILMRGLTTQLVGYITTAAVAAVSRPNLKVIDASQGFEAARDEVDRLLETLT